MQHLLRLAVVALGVTCGMPAAAVEPPLAVPYDLYELGPWPDDRLEAFRAAPGPWKVLHQERVDDATWMLLGLPDGTPADAAAGERPRYLGRVRNGERVVLTAPATDSQARLRTGRALSVTPSGGTVAVTSEPSGRMARRAHGGFRALERAVPPPRPRDSIPDDRFHAIMERVRAGGSGLRTSEDVRAVVDQVSPVQLERFVRNLSQEISGAAAIRWWEDSATRGTHRDSIMTWLQDAGVDSVYAQPFTVLNDDGLPVEVVNIVGKIASPVADAGAVMLTAHMDATASRSDPLDLCSDGIKLPSSGCNCAAGAASILANPDCEWDPNTDPSPGADDNATGIAALMEAARLLSPLDFDFDLYFVAFQAEEIGLVGSADFVDDWVANVGQEIFAVLNVDMLGYNASLNELDLITDESSEWFADWVIESGDQFVASLPVEKYVEPFGRSDHASFWTRGIDAIALLEDKELPYPGYHQYDDLWETMFPADGRPNSELQLQLSVKLVVATFARFALQHTAPDLALPAGELLADPAFSSEFVAGRDIRLTARVHNFGSSSLTFIGSTVDSLTGRVTFYDGDPDAGGTLIGQVTQTTFFGAGTLVDFQYVWDTSDVAQGFHEVFAVVEGLDNGYVQLEVSAENNRNSVSFFLEGPESEGPRILDHYVFPNPVRGTRDDLTFYYELTRDAGVNLDIRDLEGQVVGFFTTGEASFFEGNQAGPNEVSGDDLVWNSDKVEAGVYLYTLRLTENGAVTDRAKGKFALIR